ncbi:MAG: MopE-related protein [Deltaproteobacteria bacterium]|nr:MopE-related protein [Deltaproteobacteria bacterium]
MSGRNSSPFVVIAVAVLTAALTLGGCSCNPPSAVVDGGGGLDAGADAGDAGPIACVADGDCPFGQVCATGICEAYRPPDGGVPTGCVADTDCADDERCAPGSGECVVIADALPPPDREGAVCLDGALRTCGSSKVGLCRLGSEVCDQGQWSGKCVGDVGPQTEVCNALDDDCDGATDEGFDADGDGHRSCAGDCDDQAPEVNPAAIESCNGIDDDCDGDTDEETSPQCEDADRCNGTELCQAGACVAGTPVDCASLDGPCTVGVCEGATGQCRAQALADGTACDDGNACTLTTTCSAGVCGGGSPVDCSGAADACNRGVCNPASGACEPRPRTDGTPCDDGVFCTAVDLCQAGACLGAGSPDCSALGNGCNLGVCDAAADACVALPLADDTPCSDGQACTAGDVCQAGACQPGDAPDCSALDGPCTVGQCDAATGACVAVPILEGLTCDDGDPCTVATTCAAGVCGSGGPKDCSGAADACNSGVCNPTSGACEPRPLANGTACDDGAFCTTADRCQAGVCTGGPSRDCSGAGDACNLGVCDPAANGGAGACVATPRPDDTPCEDGLYCTVGERCQAGSCQGGGGRDCSAAGGSCRTGTCDEASRACTGTPVTDGTLCEDGLYCTVGDSCQAGSCQGGGGRDCSGLDDACNEGACDEAAGSCVPAPVADGTGCDDGLFCTVSDSCQGGSCQGGGARDCAGQEDACNVGVCDEAGGACSAAPVADGTPCQDGLFCTTGDACQSGSCQPGAARDCSALTDACNAGVCDEAAGSCVADPVADGSACDDGLYCTVSDSCQAGACQGGQARDCGGLDDACNLGLCDEAAGACARSARADGTACDDGRYCTVGDSCAAGVCGGAARDCSGLDGLCLEGSCDEVSGLCVAQPLTDGTACDDGLYCTVGDSCSAGACGGAARDCSGLSDACNAGVCSEGSQACEASALSDGTACDDGLYCTVGDACTAGACGGAARDCSALDGACRVGFCRENRNRCEGQELANGTFCDDGLYCTVGEACDRGSCTGGAARDCSGLGDACNASTCDEAGDACALGQEPDGTLCDDGLYCSAADTCSGGSCGGVARDCSGVTGGDACYDGVCDEALTSCVAVDNGTCQGCGAAGAPVAAAGPDQSHVPNTVIQLDGSASSDPGGQALTYSWTLTTPSGSSATLSDPTAPDPTFLGDVGDTFTACLTVTDPEGCSDTDCVDIVITPLVRLFIELTWDTDTTDVDLHYRAPGGTFFDSSYTGAACGWDEGSDCHYSEKNPDWGLGGQGVPDGDCTNDPLLDVDDTNGFGPENINHDVLWDGAGDFRVGVHYYRSGSVGATTARVRIYVDGVMVFEAFQSLACDDLWEAADVTVSGGGTTVTVTGLSRPIKAANEGSCL